MAWQDRLKEAAYTSPGGTRQVFDYEDVSLQVTKKTSSFDFPDAAGTLVQDNGPSGRRYPLRVFFSGADHDETANAFLELLEETGTGRLEHPFYGDVTVVPFGEISRRDDLKSAANQTVFEVTFWATIGVVYPTGSVCPVGAVIVAADEYNITAAETLNESLDLTTAFDRATLRNTYEALFGETVSVLQDLVATQADALKQFNAIKDSITQNIDTIAGNIVTLGLQTTQLIGVPSLAAASITAQLDAYGSLINSITEQIAEAGEGNVFLTRDLFASTFVTGAIRSSIKYKFKTKPEALSAAEDILKKFDTVVNWRDDNYAAIAAIDTGETYQQLQEAVAIAAGFLVQISFTLKQERSIVLDRARTIIDLAAELYQKTDETYDFLITSNNLTGDEILELPAGRKIVYYI